MTTKTAGPATDHSRSNARIRAQARLRREGLWPCDPRDRDFVGVLPTVWASIGPTIGQPGGRLVQLDKWPIAAQHRVDAPCLTRRFPDEFCGPMKGRIGPLLVVTEGRTVTR